jgi:hypothetical protein
LAESYDEFGNISRDLQQIPGSPVATIPKNIEDAQYYQDEDLAFSGPLRKLYSRGKRQDLLFPSDLADIEHFCVFRIRERTFETTNALRTSSAPATKDSKNIMLPMPPDLSTKYGATYNTPDVGALASGVEFLSTELRNIGEAGTSALRLFAEGGGDIAQIGGAALGVATNPFRAVFFQNPELRTHSFSYTLSPQNSDESNTIRNIIKEFKTAMLPRFSDGSKTFFTYPKVFEIEFRFDDYLFEIGTSVLTSFDVSYHAENTPSYFDITKAPTAVKIAMSFQETNILTAGDVEGRTGVRGSRK